jgi:uncharacterized protein YeaO (DUF488 family)
VNPFSSPPCLLPEFEPQAEGGCDLRIKRVYDEPMLADGFRVLVDRLWPRGITRERAALDCWEPELAPSPGLRRWFAHQARRFDEFRRRYLAELAGRGVELDELRERAIRQRVTLLHAAKDPEINHAVVLADAIRARGRATRK